MITYSGIDLWSLDAPESALQSDLMEATFYLYDLFDSQLPDENSRLTATLKTIMGTHILSQFPYHWYLASSESEDMNIFFHTNRPASAMLLHKGNTLIEFTHINEIISLAHLILEILMALGNHPLRQMLPSKPKDISVESSYSRTEKGAYVIVIQGFSVTLSYEELKLLGIACFDYFTWRDHNAQVHGHPLEDLER